MLRYPLALLALVGLGMVDSVRAATFRLEEATFTEIQDALASGELTTVELAALYLNRIAAYDDRGPRLNAISQLSPTLLAEAAALDRQRALGKRLGPLAGIPVFVKDSYDVAGLQSTAGAAVLKGLVARRDAPVVRRLRQAGALIMGKTNMWAFAYAIGSYDPASRYAWGRTRNPYTLVEDFGGSSTGSAAATAANFCAFAMGGDTGSSIRLPSARAALVGGRPSFALLPASGIIPANVSLDVIGPMTRTVRDYAAAMDVVVFNDPAPLDTRFFPASESVRPRSYAERLNRNALQGKVVGLPKPYVGADRTGTAQSLDPKLQPLWNQTVARLRALGATVKEIEWPFFHNYARDTKEGRANGYETVGLTERQSSLEWQWTDAYYFNEHLKSYRFARVPDVFAIPSPTSRQDPAGFDKIGSYKKFVREGVARPYRDYAFDRYFAAYRRWAKRDVEDVMRREGVDLLAFPAAGGDDPGAEDYAFLNGLYEGSFLGLPQISVPMGFARSGRPQGMMLMARTYYTEAEILGYAYAFEQAYPVRRPPRRTPALRGEVFTYNPNASATRRAEIKPPRVTLDADIRRVASGRYRIAGSSTDASGIGLTRVFLNGRQIGARTASVWEVTVSPAQFRRLARRDREAAVTVIATDVHGNTAARFVTLRIRRSTQI